ncbi:TPA: hypothetical protein ACH3X1_003841 [Trebouxia sp. C0004]
MRQSPLRLHGETTGLLLSAVLVTAGRRLRCLLHKATATSLESFEPAETRPAEVRMATTGTQVQMGLSDSTQAADREQEQQIKLKLLDYSYLQTDPSVVELPPGATARFIVVSGIADVFLKCSVPSGQKLVCFEHV